MVILKRWVFLCASLGCVFSSLASPREEILHLADVKPGMIGEAYTVFQGQKPESFKVRVISIVRQFLPRQDIILIRADDPRLDRVGIAAGMSGSPVYIDGKLMGAIAYGFGFAKEPLAGVTPIEVMLSDGERLGKPPQDPDGIRMRAVDSSGADALQLAPVSLPLAISGVSDSVLGYLKDELAALHVVPMRTGSGGAKTDGTPALVPGAVVGVTLVRGDLSAAVMGTLTCLRGDRIFAFGHPLFGAGVVSLPLVAGEVHTIIPSLASSVKLATPLQEVGRVVDDLRSGIVGSKKERATMVPMLIRLKSDEVDLRPFSVEVVRHRRLLPMLATTVLTTALNEAFPDVADAVTEVTTRIVLRGFEPIVLKDQFAASDGFAPRVLSMAHGPRVLSDLLNNPFAPVVVERVEVQANLIHRADQVEIVGLASPGGRIRAGKAFPLQVTLRPYHGREFSKTLTLDLPAALAGRKVKIEVASGALAKPHVARAEDLRGFVGNLRAYYPSSSIVVSVHLGDSGAQVRGSVLPNLPPSAIDTLRPSQQSRRAEIYKVMTQKQFPGPQVVSGRQEMTLYVHPPEDPGA